MGQERYAKYTLFSILGLTRSGPEGIRLEMDISIGFIMDGTIGRFCVPGYFALHFYNG